MICDPKTYRTLIRIVSIDYDLKNIEAIIPAWNPHKAVLIPFSIVPVNIQGFLKKELRLIAFVNIGAEKSDDLLFERFELAIQPDDEPELVVRQDQ